MSTHDYIIENDVGANIRNDINNAFNASVTQNSSATEPETKYPHMVWADTANDVLKVRDATNSAWVDVYVLSTGAAASGGGGGASYNGLEMPSFDATTMPTTWQVATTPIASNGVSYNAGDLFYYVYYHTTTTDIFHGVGMANVAFTYDSAKGIPWYILKGTVYTPDLSSSSLSKLLATDTPTLTSVTLQVHGDFVSVRDLTFDIAISAVGVDTPADTPYTFTGSTRFVVWPVVWAISAKYLSGDLVPMYADDDQFLNPCYMRRPDFVDTTRDKLDLEWVHSNGVSLGYMEQPQRMQQVAIGPFAINGTVLNVGNIDLFCNATLLDNDPVFLRNPYLSGVSPIGNLITKVAVDGNSIRIGTYNTANGGTLTVGIA